MFSFKLTDYEGIIYEFLILVHHCNSMSNLLDILKTSGSFKQLLPSVNKMLHLVYIVPISIPSNERKLNKLKILKSYLKFTTFKTTKLQQRYFG